MELRDLYNKESFATFVLQQDVRITPGARQFLMDRKIKLIESPANNRKPKEKTVQGPDSLNTLRLPILLEKINSLFLLVAAEILHSGDTALAKKVMLLAKCFQKIQKAEQQQIVLEQLQFLGLAEEIENQWEDIEITQTHLGLKNGREIAWLNYLRVSLQEAELAIREAYWDEQKQRCSRQDLIDGVNLVISLVDVIMKKCLGGTK